MDVDRGHTNLNGEAAAAGVGLLLLCVLGLAAWFKNRKKSARVRPEPRAYLCHRNIEGELIAHRDDCDYTPIPNHEVMRFTNMRDALREGYRDCQRCEPSTNTYERVRKLKLR